VAKKKVEFKEVRDLIDAKIQELKGLRQTSEVKDRVHKLRVMRLAARGLCNSMTIEADQG
jgi:hypothetical protein